MVIGSGRSVLRTVEGRKEEYDIARACVFIAPSGPEAEDLPCIDEADKRCLSSNRDKQENNRVVSTVGCNQTSTDAVYMQLLLLLWLCHCWMQSNINRCCLYAIAAPVMVMHTHMIISGIQMLSICNCCSCYGYAHSYDHFRHSVHLVPPVYGQQPLSFNSNLGKNCYRRMKGISTFSVAR
ncbi:uncharacterized protein A4U43_C07F17330 [Asparagus officinalis]|uniref:Uncharacterized protein n=1 Tax=Asparagus officinalis TaxID=4686 RepID=A0A5P1EEL9_ASPOF|nr:uncharacterized protein A4U43_C07F17330 [Asparagus officinalis]